MRDTWYGDRPDLVKWGTLVHLAQREGLGRIVQVAFLRRGERPALTAGDGGAEIPVEVWEHFRNVGRIEELGRRTGVKVHLFDHPFDSRQRDTYVEAAVAFLDEARPSGGQMVLLDPDTGLEPESGPKDKHVKLREVRWFWTALQDGDWLALYQHAPRGKATTGKNWRERTGERLARTCSGEGKSIKVETLYAEKITKDVTLLTARKGSAA